MKTLAIMDGDFALGSHGYKTVSGLNKTVQDLGIALREHFGVDRFHPKWGSALDSLLGQPIDGLSTMRLESEVRRVVSNYMTVQRERATQTHGDGGSVRSSEMLAVIQDVRVAHWWSTWVRVTIVLQMMDQTVFTLDMALEE